jgi:ABC-2 type transport system permease protein
VRFAQFYAPSIGIFGVTPACYSNVIFGLSTARDERLLKRVRGTPLPMPIHLLAWLTGAVVLGVASVVLMLVEDCSSPSGASTPNRTRASAAAS